MACLKSGTVWTWGKGDYFRLGHNADQEQKPLNKHKLKQEQSVHVGVKQLAIKETDNQTQIIRQKYGQRKDTVCPGSSDPPEKIFYICIRK